MPPVKGSKRSVNIELVNQSMFLDNLSAIASYRKIADRRFAELQISISSGNTKEIMKSAAIANDAKNKVNAQIGLCNRHFRKAIRAFQIHNGEDSIAPFFQKMADIFPSFGKESIELSDYWNVLGEDQDSE